MIEPINIRVDIALQVLRADMPVCAYNPVFDGAPQSFNVVRVSRSHNILFGRVLDGLVSKAHSLKPVIALKLIRKNLRCAGHGNMLLNYRNQVLSLNTWSDLDNSLAVSFHHAYGDCLSRSTTSTLASAFATNIGFVNFNLPKKA